MRTLIVLKGVGRGRHAGQTDRACTRTPRGKWYFKVTVGQDPLTGKRDQITRRGFATMAEAARERREVLAKVDRGQLAPSSAGLKLDELLDLYLDGIDADKNLALKTRFDYRQYADDYIRPYIGDRRVRDVTPEVILAWQRKLLKEGGAKKKKGKDGKPGPGKPLSPEHREPDPSPALRHLQVGRPGRHDPDQPARCRLPAPSRSARSRSTGHPRRPAGSSPSWRATAPGRYGPSSSAPVCASASSSRCAGPAWISRTAGCGSWTSSRPSATT